MTGSAPNSHGLAGDDVAPAWAPLKIDEVAAVLDHYPGRGGAVDILWHSPRPFSAAARVATDGGEVFVKRDRKSTRLNSSHVAISYAVFCLKKKIEKEHSTNAHLRLPITKCKRDA